MPALLVPPTNEDGSLRYYTEEEVEQIDIKRIGVKGEGDHIEENFAPNSSGGPRRFSCAWEHRFAGMLYFLGYSKTWVDGTTTKLSRLLPDTHPEFGRFNWVATACKITPYRFTGEIDDTVIYGQSVPVFTRAKLLVTYELVPFELYDDGELGSENYAEMVRYVTEPGFVPGGEITSQSEYIALPGGALSYVTTTGVGEPTGRQIQHGIGFTETTSIKKVQWRRLPKDMWGAGKPLTAMVKGDGTPSNRGYIGALNKTTIWGHPPLTLQLRAVEEKLIPDPTSLRHSWDITYVFAEKAVPYGHLGFYFFDNTAGSTKNGYYQTLSRGHTTVLGAGSIGDKDALFHVREMKNLFVPGGA